MPQPGFSEGSHPQADPAPGSYLPAGPVPLADPSAGFYPQADPGPQAGSTVQVRQSVPGAGSYPQAAPGAGVYPTGSTVQVRQSVPGAGSYPQAAPGAGVYPRPEPSLVSPAGTSFFSQAGLASGSRFVHSEDQTRIFWVPDQYYGTYAHHISLPFNSFATTYPASQATLANITNTYTPDHVSLANHPPATTDYLSHVDVEENFGMTLNALQMDSLFRYNLMEDNVLPMNNTPAADAIDFHPDWPWVYDPRLGLEGNAPVLEQFAHTTQGQFPPPEQDS